MSRQHLSDLLTVAEEEMLASDGERILWSFALGGDKGYRANWVDEYLLSLGIKAGDVPFFVETGDGLAGGNLGLLVLVFNGSRPNFIA